ASMEAKSHAFPLAQVQEWYELSAIPVSARFSLDRGITWESIIDLRRRNGPTFPFTPKSDNGENESGLGSIGVSREMISALRTEVEQLESMKEELEEEVEEHEKMLDKMREMEKELLKHQEFSLKKNAQVDDRTNNVPAAVKKELRKMEEKAVSGLLPSSPSLPSPAVFFDVE
ncbi:hypothetical protein PMAYCL1PPCAC_14208, partial [Pristionchus mayeri]